MGAAARRVGRPTPRRCPLTGSRDNDAADDGSAHDAIDGDRVSGSRGGNPDHLPPAKVAGLLATPASCLRRAQDIGPATSEVIGRVLGDRPLDRLRTALGILKLAHKFGPRRLEAACARALPYDDFAYATLKRILERGLDQAASPAAARVTAPAPLPLFARPVTDFFPSTGGGSCN